MAKRTVAAFFEDRENANNAALLLRRYAVSDEDVIVSPEAAAAGNPEEMPAHARGFWASLAGLFGATDESHAYAEGIRRGHVMVTAHVDEAKVDAVAAMLERHGSVDLNEREIAWHAEGWAGGSRAEDSATPPCSGLPRSAAEFATAAAGVLFTPSAAGAYRSLTASHGAASIKESVGDDHAFQPGEGSTLVEGREVIRRRVRVHPYLVEIPPARQASATFIDAMSVQRATNMEVVGSDGRHVGIIDHVAGTVINLRCFDPLSKGMKCVIPTTWVQFIDDRVTLKFTADDAKRRWTIA